MDCPVFIGGEFSIVFNSNPLMKSAGFLYLGTDVDNLRVGPFLSFSEPKKASLLMVESESSILAP